MEEGSAPKRRLTIFGRAARRKRIFARLREGWAYDEIAREERLTAARVRQIVSEVLQKRQVDDGMDHALLQLARLGLYRIHTSRIRSALTRLRGFAGGKAGFTIFLVRKYLVWNVWATGNIVKKACSEDLPDSQGIVFVIESTSLCSFEEPNGGRTARRTSIGASS
ncbi:MAG TPA: hypothetical protein VJX23_10465, partial [Candidatus Binataceae bacterium]|nr:hypothetical protein [Candidatus Binataceae bacterium]